MCRERAFRYDWFPGEALMTRVGLTTLLSVLPSLAAAAPPQIGFDGLSPVRVGMTVAQAEQALHAKLSVEFPNDDGPTGCGIAGIEGRDNAAFSYMIEDGRVTRADLGGLGVRSAIRTANGIGLGSSIGEIRRAYGKSAKSHPNAYEETEPDFEIKSANGKAAIVFETEQGRVVRIHSGRLPSAEYIEGCD